MTEIAFHFNTPNKIGYACRLLRKAYGRGAQVVVTGEPALLRDLDVTLWTFGALEFVPHCLGAAQGLRVQARSPILLADSTRGAPHQQVLVNLGPVVPDGFKRFERLIEVVGGDDEDRQSGRRRWKHYADRGYSIQRHDVATDN